MQILTIASQKGGVGKTALALNLGWAFAKAGIKTIVLDVDPQSGLSRSVAAKLVERKGIHDVIQGNATWASVVMQTRVPGFALLPLGRVLPWEAAQFEATLASGQPFRDLVADQEHAFDLLIVDTPAGIGSATLGALRAADHLVSPLQAEPGALRSASSVLDTLAYLAQHEGNAPNLLGFVIGMVNKHDPTSTAIVTETWRSFPPDIILKTTIPRHPAFLEATAKGVPVGALTGEGKQLGWVFDQLAEELIRRMELAS